MTWQRLRVEGRQARRGKWHNPHERGGDNANQGRQRLIRIVVDRKEFFEGRGVAVLACDEIAGATRQPIVLMADDGNVVRCRSANAKRLRRQQECR
jgi:hypothetical protein